MLGSHSKTTNRPLYCLPLAVFLLAVLSMFIGMRSGDRYVEEGTFDLPTNGAELETPPLRNDWRYSVIVSSSQNIRPIYSLHYEDTSLFRGFFGHTWTLRGDTVLFFDDRPIFDDDLWEEERLPIGTSLHFHYWGQGKPLRVSVLRDVSALVKNAQIHIRAETLAEHLSRDGAPAWLWTIGSIVVLAYIVLLSMNPPRFVTRLVSYFVDARREREEMDLMTKAERWRLRVYKDRNFLDKNFREQYVRAKPEEIVARKNSWSQQYDEVMKDEKLRLLLKERSPEVLEYLEARQEMVLLEQRNAVTQRSPERGRITPEQFRAKAVRAVKTKAEDEAAKFFAAVETELEMQDAVDAMIEEIKEKADLSEQQKEERIRRVTLAARARIKALGGEDEQEIQTVL